jgi:hypothetical protein
MAFQAKYEGRCLDCREPIEPGEWIVSKPDGGYAHEVCPEAPEELSPLDLHPGEVVCDRCFLVKQYLSEPI